MKDNKLNNYSQRYPQSLFILVFLCLITFLSSACDSGAIKEVADAQKEPDSKDSPSLAAISDHHLEELFIGMGSEEAAASLDLAQFPFIDPDSPPSNLQDQALWPPYSFLMGEVYRLRGDAGQAKKWYRGLTVWAVNDPYKDGWGASGLVSVALWRWCQQTEKIPNLSPREGEEILTLASKLWKTRFLMGMSEPYHHLMALPQLKEETLRSLVALAVGQNKTKEALGYFIEYLAVARTFKLSVEGKALFKKATDEYQLSLGKIALIMAKRMESLKNYEGAKQWFKQAELTGSLQVQTEASFHLASLGRPQGKCPDEKTLTRLDNTIEYATDPDLVQDALYLRAVLFMREGWCNNENEFTQSLNKLLKDFPKGRRADDAYYRLAVYHLNLYWATGRDEHLDQALLFFKKIQDFDDRDDYLDSSWFQPAMALYARQKPGDRQKAADLLKKLVDKRPNGPLQLSALFWLGRIAAESGDAAESQKYFQTVIQNFPYDYYAIRARMHLHLGQKAATEVQVDEATQKELEDKYDAACHQVAATPPAISGQSPYHHRLKRFLKSRLYYRALANFIDIKRQNQGLRAKRCETIPLAEMDQHFLLAPTVILLSLRQDALAAVDRDPEAKKVLEIAGAIRYLPKDDPKPYSDWPLIIYLTEARDKPYKFRSKLQTNLIYPAIAYPQEVFALYLEKYGQKFQVPPELLYGIIRHESGFYPLAVSPGGAMGLVPFSSSTFKALDRRWKLLKMRQKESPEDFLLDPDANIYLGARFFREGLFPRQKGDVVLALLEFYSGYSAVRNWLAKWRQLGRQQDYEFMLETARHRSTTYFVKHVLGTFNVIQSAGICQKN